MNIKMTDKENRIDIYKDKDNKEKYWEKKSRDNVCTK